MDLVSSPSPAASGERWRFLRDVAVFELKLFLDNVRDFALVPISLVAALIDFVYKGEREGALFYKVLRWGAHSEEVIDVYSAIENHPPGSFKVNPAYTVDAVVARLEGVVVHECEKGEQRQASGRRWITRSTSCTGKPSRRAIGSEM